MPERIHAGAHALSADQATARESLRADGVRSVSDGSVSAGSRRDREGSARNGCTDREADESRSARKDGRARALAEVARKIVTDLDHLRDRRRRIQAKINRLMALMEIADDEIADAEKVLAELISDLS